MRSLASPRDDGVQTWGEGEISPRGIKLVNDNFADARRNATPK